MFLIFLICLIWILFFYFYSRKWYPSENLLISLICLIRILLPCLRSPRWWNPSVVFQRGFLFLYLIRWGSCFPISTPESDESLLLSFWDASLLFKLFDKELTFLFLLSQVNNSFFLLYLSEMFLISLLYNKDLVFPILLRQLIEFFYYPSIMLLSSLNCLIRICLSSATFTPAPQRHNSVEFNPLHSMTSSWDLLRSFS